MIESVPGATYRLQFNSDFTFANAETLVPYLSALGITHVYASPLFAARKGSRHGYDVIDYNKLNQELGTRDDFDRFIAMLHRHDMGLLLDIVPNHMGIGGSENPLWIDVLKRGKRSPYSDWFDIDWNAGGDAMEYPEKLGYSRRTSGESQNNGGRVSLVAEPEFAGATDRSHSTIPLMEYRRFFDVDDLAAVRVESTECFAQTHRLLFELLENESVQGVRVDHIDGLFDPVGYCELLRAHDYATGSQAYIIVEKILARHEALRADWQVAGTTGYDFCNIVNALFVDAESEGLFDRLYRDFTHTSDDFNATAYACKIAVIEGMFSREVGALARDLRQIAASHVDSSAYTQDALRAALREIIAAFPVYRTYVGAFGASDDDRGDINRAIALARRRCLDFDDSIFTFIDSILTGDAVRCDRPRYTRRQVIGFAMKFQQYTPAIMAKAVEDTAFYRYVRLLSLNEVGGDPNCFGISTREFHEAMNERAKRLPHAISATSTHDVKRGEDVRARINVLSELPSQWRGALASFERFNRCHKRNIAGLLAPDRIDEYLLYQTLLGTWPLMQQAHGYGEKIETYLRKAIREAKRHSSWVNPNKEYEDAAIAFLRGILAEPKSSPFWSTFFAFLYPIARIGMLNGLGQTLLKITAPGVPDFYQGSELWTFSLVDPDNRGSVDYDLRRKMLDAAPIHPNLEQARELLAQWRDGRIKTATTRIALAVRRARLQAFVNGEGYAALEVAGSFARRAVAFENGGCVTIVPRLVAPLLHDGAPFPLGERVWKETNLLVPDRLQGMRLRDAFTGESIFLRERTPLAEIFSDFPVALLVPDEVV